MKLSAVFENSDAADAAVNRLRREGIRVKSPWQTSTGSKSRESEMPRFMVFPSAYDPYEMMFPYEVPHLNPYVLPYDGMSGGTGEAVLSVEVPDYDGFRARDILLNLHGTGVSLS